MLLGIGAWLLTRPSSAKALDCPPKLVRFRDGGSGPPIAYCADPKEKQGGRNAGAALAVGQKLDLNSTTIEELALIPGVGPHLATVVIKARDEKGGFKTWEDVDSIPGVGASKIELLRANTELNPSGGQPE